MRLLERTLFVKFTTDKDIVAAGGIVEIVDAVERGLGLRWQTIQDLVSVRSRAVGWSAARQELSRQWLQGGLMQRVRNVWRAPTAVGGEAWMEIAALNHPYSGTLMTSMELRIPEQMVAAREGVDAVVEVARWCMATFDPLYLHAHLTDDHAIQNCLDEGMLRLGFGVDAATLDEDRPGREVSRGTFRYASCWLTGMGVPLLDRTDELDRGALPGDVEPFGDAVLVRLYDDPACPDEPAAREAQRALRKVMRWEELARAERWTSGFWQRRG
jgi:hypothetical protein